jgi:hypothetical protein
LYGFETWSLVFREEHRLRVFENMVLRRIFGLKREEVTGGQREQHDEELHNLYSSPNNIRVIRSRRVRWLGHVACMREMRNASILLGNPEGKKSFRRSRHRWENNIKMDPKEMGWKV